MDRNNQCFNYETSNYLTQPSLSTPKNVPKSSDNNYSHSNNNSANNINYEIHSIGPGIRTSYLILYKINKYSFTPNPISINTLNS